jgi:hypothetical protein
MLQNAFEAFGAPETIADSKMKAEAYEYQRISSNLDTLAVAVATKDSGLDTAKFLSAIDAVVQNPRQQDAAQAADKALVGECSRISQAR